MEENKLDNPPALVNELSKTLAESCGLELTEPDVKKIAKYFRKHRLGYQASIPLTCKGDNCCFKTDCPFAEIGKLPEGKKCPLESMLLDGWVSEYANELDIDVLNPVDRKLLSDLVVWELLGKRAAQELGENPLIVQENVVTLTQEGQEVKKKELNQLIIFMEKAQRWKLKLLDTMVATKKSKVKQPKVIDPGSYAASLIEKARQLQKEAEDVQVSSAKQVEEVG